MGKEDFTKRAKMWWSGGVAIVTALFNSVLYTLDISGNKLSEIFANPITKAMLWFLFAAFCFIQIIVLKKENDQLTQYHPRIVVHKAYVDKRWVFVRKQFDANSLPLFYVYGEESPIPVHAVTETIGGTRYYNYFPDNKNEFEHYCFAHVRFANKAEFSFKNNFAEKVWAEITFYDYDNLSEPIFEDIKGRWAGTSQPTESPTQNKRELLEVDFAPNQLDWELDIAMRHPKEPLGFVFNNDSYEFTEFRNNEFALRKSKYLVKVVLRGVNLKPEGEEFRFSLHIGRKNDDFKIEQV